MANKELRRIAFDKEAKKMADMVYKKVKKEAGDKQAKKEGAKDRKKTIEHAKKVRDETTQDLRS